MVRKPVNPFSTPRPKASKAFKAPPPRNFATEAALGRAIEGKTVVALYYRGKDRTFAPHLVRETEDADVVVYGIQISPSDPFGKKVERNFTVSEIQNLRTTGERFTKDPAFDVRKHRKGVLYIIKD